MTGDYTEIQILLIEDSEDDAELTKRALRQHNLGNNLIHLRDGAEALEFIFCKGQFSERNIAMVPKVILLDLNMPKVSGLEVLQRIKNDERTRNIPVVVMTSSREQQDLVSSYKLGVNAYVVKPVEFEAFARAVADLGLFWLVVNETPGVRRGGEK